MRVDSTRRVVALGVVLAAAALFCIATPALAQEPNTPLRGVITDDQDQAPQPGASVSIPELGVVAITDEKGEYTLSVPQGTYTVRVEAAGHLPFEKTVTVGAAPTFLDFEVTEDRLSEVIVVVGARTPRSRTETTAPVDVVTNEVITESSHTETNQILNTIAPSFNATHMAIQDGTDHIDPADLRSLGPEHVLVLVNGKRLHQSSLINVYSGGTVGVDLNAIPTNAIARIEVLRDGAASQYGSDAIAGVINIVLKDNVDLVHLYTMTGVTAHNDGAQFKLGANTGWKLGKRGFVNVTGEFFARGRTNRSDPWTGDIFPGIEGTAETDAELARRGLGRGDFRMAVGQAGALVGTSFVNAGYPLDETFTLHAHGGYTYRKGYASGFYRLPSQEAKVDLQRYPIGFLPEINPTLNAWTGTVGVRGKKGPWDGDLSLTQGGDRFHFYVDNSLNASLGPASPTHFDAGRLGFHQTSLNLDGVRTIRLRPFKSLSAVAGAELRHENYTITAGQPESYEQGPEVTSTGEPKLPGAQVFPGFRPSDEHDRTRNSGALYAGLESQPTARTNVDIGGRFERYGDFGSTVTGKVAGRVAALKRETTEVALRGAVSTGFRAPGLQQIWYSTIATQFINDELTGTPTAINILITPNRSRVAEAFGVPRLKEETSVNFSGGLTARLLGNLSVSTDYYRVTMKDRVVLSGLFANDDSVIGDVISSIVSPFPGVAAAQFYVNAVDTTTNGLDVVVDYTHRLSKGVIKVTAAANFTDTTVDDVKVPASMEQVFQGVAGGREQVQKLFLGRYGENRLEDILPRRKGTLGVRGDWGAWSGGVRANYFGPTVYRSDGTDSDGTYLDESFGSEVTFDVDVGYRVGGLWWSIGANNVFDHFPDRVKRDDNLFNGAFLYSPAGQNGGAPYGIDGAFYYARAEYKY